MSDPFDETLRARFADLAACLIPGDGTMPRADCIGLEHAILDRVLTVRPDLAEDLLRALTALGDRQPADGLRALMRDDPPGYAALTSAIAGGYLMAPGVKQSLGYPEQEPRPYPDPGAHPDCLAEGMLEAVLLRGEVFRKV